MKSKTKQISKKPGHKEKGKAKPAQEKMNEEGEPEIKNLSDFVISIQSVYHSKAIYTGGRILTSNSRIYALCNDDIVVYDIESKRIVNTIQQVRII